MAKVCKALWKSRADPSHVRVSYMSQTSKEERGDCGCPLWEGVLTVSPQVNEKDSLGKKKKKKEVSSIRIPVNNVKSSRGVDFKK